MGSYRGKRHAMGLPVRGQRTRTQVCITVVVEVDGSGFWLDPDCADQLHLLTSSLDPHSEEVEQAGAPWLGRNLRIGRSYMLGQQDMGNITAQRIGRNDKRMKFQPTIPLANIATLVNTPAYRGRPSSRLR